MKVGIWFVGARGSIATTVAVGVIAARSRALGLVTENEPFAGLSLPPVEDIVIGGSDTSSVELSKVAERLAAEGVFDAEALRSAHDQLVEVDARVRPGIDDQLSPRDAIAQLSADLGEFQSANQLDEVVVVNVSTTEMSTPHHEAHDSLEALDAALDDGRAVLLPSSLYAYAAFASGCCFVDFTPSQGARLPALAQLAQRSGVAYAGNDGKTGETLVKTALAPMFRQRNLKVRSWAGTNILGGGDGRSLAEPERKQQKLDSKAQSLEAALGYRVDHPVHIDYLEDMGQWKTAWNHISFEGFLGTKMSMQLTWQGCDSALAAPLVLDLVRLTAAAHAKGQTGVLKPLAFFFKDPIDTDEHDLGRQYDALCEWTASTL